MEDARCSTSSKILVRTFKTLIESPEADITSIPVVRSEQFPTSSSGDIPVSVQELVYNIRSEGVGTSTQLVDRDDELLPSKDKKKELSQKKENSPLEAPHASTCKNMPQQVPNTGKKAQRLNRREREPPNGTSPTPEL
ncbi:hypothetical protein O181_132419 [Austropuccinia psidii MF-1]|uniref:Uncharacterized protein n=1 Tax=Austropuccinia psidii MF-1 TaxID=1389203 RepID=A0A9Q3L7A4_9BASI|nr:hypothetical protein [Austropuccinia psidii MF-1]